MSENINPNLEPALDAIESSFWTIENGWDRILNHIQEEINEIKNSDHTPEMKDRKYEQLLRLQTDLLDEIDLNKQWTQKSLSDLKEDFLLYWQAIEEVNSVFTPARTMEIMHTLDSSWLKPANIEKAFKLDKNFDKAIFNQDNTDFLKRRYEGGLKKLMKGEWMADIYIDWIDNEQSLEMINHIYQAKDSLFHFTEAINFIDKYSSNKYEVTEWDKYVLIDSLFARLLIEKINTDTFTIDEYKSLKKAFKTLEKNPNHYMKLLNLLDLVLDKELFFTILEFAKNDPEILQTLQNKSSKLWKFNQIQLKQATDLVWDNEEFISFLEWLKDKDLEMFWPK